MKTILHKFLSVFRTLGEVYAREFRTIRRDQGVVLFFLFLPLAYPVIYSLIYNRELVRDVPMVVVDHDRTQQSRDLVRRMDAAQGARLAGYAADLAEGRRAINEREAYAIMEIPEGFGRKIGRGEQASAQLYCETSLLLRYRSLLFSATEVALSMGADIQSSDIGSLGMAGLASRDPMPVVDGELGNLQSGFDSFIMPGVLILILQQCIVLAVGMMGGGRNERALKGLYTPASGSTLLTMTGLAGCYITILALPVIWLTHYVPVVFQFPMAGDTLEIFAFLLPLVLACIALGFIVQLFTSEREAIFLVWVATSVAFLFLSGLTWPRYAMAPVWKLASDIIPATWGINGFILMNANGASLADIGPYYRNLWILAGVYWLLAWIIQKYMLRVRLRREASRP